ncbi:hypothetical protein Bca101_009137 [Brassica carinata]
MAVKTDMSKAYDRLEWSFIESVLLRFGFALSLTNLIMQCVSSVTYSFLVNDSVHGRVVPSRGIRQGDPLSPYLFILCGEVLSGLCKRAQNSGHLSGLKVAKAAPRLNHLLFADDTMFFLHTDEESCSTLLQILHQYKISSGQLINKAKSSISFSAKTLQAIRQRVKLHLGIEKEGGAGKYLGLPEHFGRRKKDLFTGIVDRIRVKAASWSSRHLSSAGKLVMLKSVLTAIPSHSMTCFLLPRSLCDRIQSALTRFWWDASPDQKKMCWVAWDKLTKPKALGGLGLRDIRAFNTALLAKQAWRILTKPDCLLARVLTGKYCSKSQFLITPDTKTMSHGWKGVLAGRDLLITNLGKVIGNGEDTRVWRDPWLSTNEPLTPTGPSAEADQDLYVSDFLCRGSADWNIQRIIGVIPHLLPQILRLRPSITGAQDSFAWLASRSGAYSVKSAYYAAMNIRNNEDEEATDEQRKEEEKLTKGIWSSKTSPKLKLFLWKVTHGALPLGDNLARRGMLANSTCRHCGNLETPDHLFLHCQFTRRIWAATLLKQSFKPPELLSFAAALLSSQSVTNLPPLGATYSLFPWICWSIWIARNQSIFENRSLEPANIISNAVCQAREWTAAQLPSSSPNGAQRHRTPSTPGPSSELSCFTDAAWTSNTNRAGCGWCVLDTRGSTLLQGKCSFNHISTALMAEALAIRSALTHASEAGFSGICVRSDCQALIGAISSKCHSADLYGILRDIETLSSSFLSISFRFIPRSLNFRPDSLAKSVLHSSSPTV